MNLFDFLIDLFFKETPEKKLRKQINLLIKTLRAQKPPMLEGKNELIPVDFAEYLFYIFHPLLPALGTLKMEFKEKGGIALKHLLLEKITSDKQMANLAILDEDTLKKDLAELDEDSFFSKVENALKEYIQGFNESEKTETNTIYNQVQLFSRFADLDFVTFFKEFDPQYNPKDPNYTPRFTPKDAKFFIDDFKILNRNLNSQVFDDRLIKNINGFLEYRGQPQIDEKKFKTDFKKLKQLNDRNLIEYFISAVSKDLNYHGGSLTLDENIVTSTLDKIVDTKRALIEKYMKRMKNMRIDGLQDKLFSGANAPPLHHYTEQANQAFEHLQVETYAYTRELSLVKAFVILQYNTEIGQTINFIVIKGNFHERDLAKELNDIYYTLNEMLDRINNFDNQLSDTKEIGQRIKRLMLSSKREKNALFALGDIVHQTNEEAKKIVKDFIVSLKALHEIFDKLVDDFNSGSKKRLTNIKTFSGTKTPLQIQKMIKTKESILMVLNIVKEMNK